MQPRGLGAASWGAIYLVNNNWRGKEILEVIPNAQVVCTRQDYVATIRRAEEEDKQRDLKSLVISETFNHVMFAGGNYLWVPRAST